MNLAIYYALLFSQRLTIARNCDEKKVTGKYVSNVTDLKMELTFFVRATVFENNDLNTSRV